jgi:hypothetical protein
MLVDSHLEFDTIFGKKLSDDPKRFPARHSRLRGNDGYFDRLVLKKARGGTKAWPDTQGRQYSSLTCQDFSRFFSYHDGLAATWYENLPIESLLSSMTDY